MGRILHWSISCGIIIIYQFDEAGEILTRYDALKQTRDDLLQKEQSNQDAIETERVALLKLMEVFNSFFVFLWKMVNYFAGKKQ